MNRTGGYPHPVIDGGDDVASQFVAKNVSVTDFIEDVVINFDVEVDDPTLLRLMEEGTARLSLKWRCPATLSAGEFPPDLMSDWGYRTRCSASFPQDDVVGPVIVDVKIIATRAIADFAFERQNADYGPARFQISPGDVLGVAGTFRFEPKKTYDPMNPPLESCIGFEQAGPGVDRIRIRLDDPDKVWIMLPEETFTLFNDQVGRPDVQAALVLLPALTETLWRIQVSQKNITDDGFEDTAWYRALMGVVAATNCAHLPPFEQAQRILEGNPVRKAFEQLSRDLEDE